MSDCAFRTLLLDIEGTVAPIRFVTDVLFPYARKYLAAFLDARWSEPSIRDVLRQVSLDAGGIEFSRESIVAHLLSLMDRDAKATGLKALQGMVWEQGYAEGTLRSTLFADVAPALRALHARGVDLRIYSSGSIAAQKLFFAHTADGDLTPLLSGYYDTTTGAKQEAESYRRIAERIGRPAGDVLFVSDVAAELLAAREAGMQTRLAVRPGNRPTPENCFARIESLDEILQNPPA
ncbi:MAG: acireductone synthase [Planctomycetia bacterium]|nr:MAG: acireductone synthase [Planctomycetia bacterium]